MIRIRLYPIFSILSISLALQTLSAFDINWLDLVRQRLDLEQKTPDVFIQQNPSSPKQEVLDKALVFYHETFNSFYADLMPAFESCKTKYQSEEWCDLKDYLESNKTALEREYSELQKHYRRGSIGPNRDSRYQTDIKHYYDNVVEVIKVATIEGQDKEVKLFKASVKEKRQEMIKEKRSDETAILQEEP